MTEKRAYKSQLRETQTKQTRALIVDALIEQVCDTGRSDFSLAEVAERAGVSVRTIYRHFPKRQDLFDGITAEINVRSAHAVPEGFDGMREHLERLLQFFEANPKLIEASHVAGLGREARQHGRRARGEQTRAVIESSLPGLSKRDRRIAWALFRTVFSSHVWRTMRTELGLDADETRDAMTWLGESLVGAVKRRAEEGGEQ